MAYSYPIWNEIISDAYRTNKNFGARNTFRQYIKIGSSKYNSHNLCDIEVRRSIEYKGKKEYIKFILYIDGIAIKIKYFKNNNGKAGKLVEQENIS